MNRILTPEEFDALNATVPGLHSGCFLRLRTAIGDNRSGAEYLADFHADKSVPYKPTEIQQHKMWERLWVAVGGEERDGDKGNWLLRGKI